MLQGSPDQRAQESRMQSVSLAASNFALDSVIQDGIKDGYVHLDTNGQETAVSQTSSRLGHKDEKLAAMADKRRNNQELQRSAVLTHINEHAKQSNELSSDQLEVLGFDDRLDEHNSNQH